MANYWAIAIGINQYQHFQPLNYAERDARTLHNFFVVEAGFAPERCLLLTDNTPIVDQEHAAPTRDTLLSYLAEICQNALQPDDTLWCFFSGYGLQFQGQDYLMPINGDSTEVGTTGIPVESLFSIFRAAPTSNIILVLDINRSQGMVGGAGVGAHTITLAQEYGIATLLSCQPHQFSHETLGLRMGLFAAAVHEGISAYGCMTLEQLAQFLGDRLPELSEHHCRPRQDPLVYIPDHKRYQLILPGKPGMNPPPEDEFFPDPDAAIPLPLPPVNPFGPEGLIPPPPRPEPLPTEPDPQPLPKPDPIQPVPDLEEGDEQTWNNLVKLSILGGLILVGLVIFKNAGTLLRPPQPKPVGVLPGNPTSPLIPGNPGTGTGTSPGTVLPPVPQPNPLPNTVDFSVSPSPTPGGGTNQATGPSPSNQGAGGGTAVSPLPNPPASPNPPAIAPPLSDQSILNAARATLSRFRAEAPNNQVSDIVDAIRQMRQIRPDQPLYYESQQVIERWSQIILDIAMGRAQQRNNGDSLIAAKNYNGAIAAARMVPTDRPALYSVAQQLINEWSQKTLSLANARAGEGYTSLAIQVAQQVPSGTVAYAQAQQAIATWQTQLPPQPPTIP